MNMTEAIQRADQEGLAVRREAWKPGSFIFWTVSNTVSKDYIPKFVSFPPLVKEILTERDQDIRFEASVSMFMDGVIIPSWSPADADTMEDDWEIVG